MLTKKLALVALFACVAASDTFALNITNYAVGDVLVCFRKAGGADDLVVDAGPVSRFLSATTNQYFNITNYTGKQLAFCGTNSVIWSAFTYYDDTVSPNYTLFVSNPRSSTYRAQQPYQDNSSDQQFLTYGYMQEVQQGAAANISYVTPTNTGYAVLEPDDTTGNTYRSGQSYDYVMSAYGPFGGDWNGNPEKTTSSSFTTSAQVARSDFDEMIPTDEGGAYYGSYIGYFEFNTNGLMTYIAFGTAPSVTTVAATGINSTNAQLNSTVNPWNDSSTVYFQYGLSNTYGSTSVTNIAGTSSGSYGISVSNLLAATTYHFRVAAYNHTGTNFGADMTFTTSSGSAVQQPVITNIALTNTTAWVTFTTGGSGTYTLRGTNNLVGSGAPTNWPAISAHGGTGGTVVLSDSSLNASNKFYLITAQ